MSLKRDVEKALKEHRAMQAEAREIVRQFFAEERNSVGDYWGKDTAKRMVERLLGEPIERSAA